MKKFADKLSLEYTQFSSLQHLVEEAIQFTYDALDDKNNSHSPNKLAETFCKLQDEERKKDEGRKS